MFSKEGYIKKRKANAISELITELCQEVRIHALRLVDAFDRPTVGTPVDIDRIMAACQDPDSKDDMTLLVLCRHAGPAPQGER